MEQTLSPNTRAALVRIQSFKDWRLFYKLLFTSLVMMLPALLFTGATSTSLSRNAMLDQARVTLMSTGRNTGAAIDQYLLAHREDIVMLSKLPEILAYAASPNDNAARANALKTLTAASAKRDYDSVAIVNPRGATLLSSHGPDIGENVGSRDYFEPALRVRPLYPSQRSHS